MEAEKQLEERGLQLFDGEWVDQELKLKGGALYLTSERLISYSEQASDHTSLTAASLRDLDLVELRRFKGKYWTIGLGIVLILIALLLNIAFGNIILRLVGLVAGIGGAVFLYQYLSEKPVEIVFKTGGNPQIQASVKGASNAKLTEIMNRFFQLKAQQGTSLGQRRYNDRLREEQE